jgi:hypothetical protein
MFAVNSGWVGDPEICAREGAWPRVTQMTLRFKAISDER